MGWVDNALGTQANSVMVGARRAELLATNLANADTPGYRARDIDFRAVMADAEAGINRCLLYTSPSPRDVEESRMPSSA